MALLVTPKSPALPLANSQYEVAYQNRYSSVLRLYFNQLDTVHAGVLGPLGMQYLDAPHIAAVDTVSQYAPANDTSTIVVWNTATYIKGFTLNLDNTATVGVSGVYLINYNLNLANTANTAHDAFTWLQVNGDQLANSARRFTLQARKSTGVFTYMSAHATVMFNASAGDILGSRSYLRFRMVFIWKL